MLDAPRDIQRYAFASHTFFIALESRPTGEPDPMTLKLPFFKQVSFKSDLYCLTHHTLLFDFYFSRYGILYFQLDKMQFFALGWI